MLINFSQLMNTALLITVILAATAIGIVFLMLFRMLQGVWRHVYTRKFDDLSIKIHSQWRAIVRGEIPAETWRTHSVRCEIVQAIVIQEIGAATDKDRHGLQQFLRSSGLVERCIERVRRERGWSRRRAMLALGNMRVREAIAPLSEALEDWQLETRMAAVQALGRTGLAEAAEPIIEIHMAGGLKVPSGPIANALTRCYFDQPAALLPYLRRASGESRELLARVASELATSEMADEMVYLAEDPLAEVRACAARSLAVAPIPLAIPTLANLIRDDVWFVRLRAVSALNQIRHPRVILPLLEGLRDSNRLVRMRSAEALSKFEDEIVEILRMVVASRDRYALHALISAVELGGRFEKVMAQLADPAFRDETTTLLLATLREASAGQWSIRPADPVVESVFP